jgi:hypothetical protein
MARKIRRFDKVIDTPEALAIYNEQRAYSDEIKRLEVQKKEHFRIYCDMEGKYSLGTISDPYAGQGFRGYDYKYPSQEVKAKECAEREAYYTEHITPLNERIHELNTKVWALEETLCIALWGFGQEHYRIKHNLENAEKELAEQIAYVEKLREQLKNLEKTS